MPTSTGIATPLALTLVTLATLTARSAAAQAPTYKRDLPDSLVAQATVTEAAALATAQRRVPRGKVAALELEREKGVLIYSLDFKVPGKTGIDEVNVDAKTGAVLHVEHESPAAEQKEATVDAKAAHANRKANAKRATSTP